MAELLAALKTLTVVELQSELKSRGLKKRGNKAALIKRLEEHILSVEQPVPGATEGQENEGIEVTRLLNVEDEGVTHKETTVKSDFNNSEPEDVAENESFTKELTETIHQEAPHEEGKRRISITDSNNAEDICSAPDNEDENVLFTIEQPVDTDNNFDAEVPNNSIATDTDLPPLDITRKINSMENKEAVEGKMIDDGQPVDDVEQGIMDENVTNILHKEEREEAEEDQHLNEKEIEEEEEQRTEKTVNDTKDDDGMQQEDVLDYEEMDDFQEPQVDKEQKDEKMDEVGEINENDEKSEEKGEVDENDGQKETEEKTVREVVKEKPKPKIITPVVLKNRISLKGPSDETAEERAARRKRRWGSTTKKQATVTISSDSIKKLIPDVKIDRADLENVNPFDQDDEVTEIIREEEVSCESPRKKGRTVRLDSAKKVTLAKMENKSEAVLIESDTESQSQNAPRKKTILLHSMDTTADDIDGKGERERSPSPAKNKASNYLHIVNLVRPFTINQLKSLVSKSGTICENGFWINNIKSHCYVQLSSEDEAKTARDALHGLKWPPGNPKVLNVDFALPDVMYKETDGAIGERPTVVVEIKDDDNKETDRKTDRQEEKQRNRKSSEKQLEKKEVSVRGQEKEESPAKVLDDLFRKTKATPCIYWLPLSDAEITKRKKNQQTEEARNREPTNRTNRRQSPVRRTSYPDDRRRPARSWR